MPRLLTPLLPLPLLLLPLLGCGSSATPAAPASDGDAGADDAAPIGVVGVDAGRPTFHFLDVTRGGQEITGTARWGDVLDVRLVGLPPATAVTIHARSTGYESYATFTAGEDGTVDVATTAPSTGTYTGVDPDGLIWSMAAKPDPSDKTADPLALYFRAEVTGSTVASATLPRSALAADVTTTAVAANGLVGTFFAPPPDGQRHGAVIAFGGSEGGASTGEYLAAYFASLGHPALGLAYFAAPGLPSTLDAVPLEYFQKAHDWLATQAQVDAAHVVIVGGSRGGELALLLGSTFSWVTAVVAEVPSGVVWPGWDANGNFTAAWTFGGQPLAYIPDSGGQPQTVTLPDGTQATAGTPAFDHDLHAATAAQLAAATSHVENTAGPILMTAGGADQLWPSCELAQIAMDRLTQAGHAAAHGDQLVCYPGAGHNVGFAIGFPTASELATSDPSSGEVLALGGDPASIARAQRDADTRVRAFLAANAK